MSPAIDLLPLVVPAAAVAAGVGTWVIGAPARIDVGDDQVVVTPRGPNRIWAFRGPVRLPRWSVARAAVDPAPTPPEVRLAGTHILGVVTMGTFRRLHEDTRELWITRGHHPAVVIDLVGNVAYRRVVAQVHDPDDVVARLTRR